MARRFAHRFRLEWREFKLRRVTFAATWPHARPLTFAWWRFFLTTFAARIVHACSKRYGKVQLRTTATTVVSTCVGTVKPAAAIATAAAFSSGPPTTAPFSLTCSCRNWFHAGSCVMQEVMSCNMQNTTCKFMRLVHANCLTTIYLG